MRFGLSSGLRKHRILVTVLSEAGMTDEMCTELLVAEASHYYQAKMRLIVWKVCAHLISSHLNTLSFRSIALLRGRDEIA